MRIRDLSNDARAPRQPKHTIMDLELRNQRVLITGGSRGIGLACAAGFLREGARVAIVSRSAENLAKACAKLAEVQGDFAKDVVVVSESFGCPVTWRTRLAGKSVPITASVCSSSFCRIGKRSIRAASTPSTVLGICSATGGCSIR